VPHDLRVTHIGGPTVLIEVDGWRLLTDPTFDPPGRRYTFGWGTASRKVEGPALSRADLGPIDAVLLSHDHHADNMDDAGRALLPSAGVVVTTRSAERRLRRGRVGQDQAGQDRLGQDQHRLDGVRGLAPWETTRLEAPGKPDLVITATPCRHGPPLSRPIVGDVIGFAIQNPARPACAVWVSGDTVLFDGVREVARRLTVDTAILHLGGVRFGLTGPIRYSMTAREAIELIGLLAPRAVVPVHFEGWTHFREQEAELRSALTSAPADVSRRVHVLTRGIPASI
jgi:L-ascorbate metabolism protein UlaG (beta-lactamase superfamily)